MVSRRREHVNTLTAFPGETAHVNTLTAFPGETAPSVAAIQDRHISAAHVNVNVIRYLPAMCHF